jgi:hypothetical protein
MQCKPGPDSDDLACMQLLEAAEKLCEQTEEKNVWDTVKKTADLIASVIPGCLVSVNILSLSKESVKCVCSGPRLLGKEDMFPISAMPSVLEVMESGHAVYVEASQ